MSESEQDEAAEAAATEDGEPAEEETPEAETERTARMRSCQRCGREQGLVGKYDIWLCRQCFREIARGMGFKKYS